MELTRVKQKEYIRRIIIARMTILAKNGFFGLLLMHMKFALDDTVETAATDGERIYLNPTFLDEVSDQELVFILMHEIMHVALRHTTRQGDRQSQRFNLACDIVVNSNILQACGMDTESITLRLYGESVHQTPDGAEGYEYTAEEVYDMLPIEVEMVDRIRFSDEHARWGSVQDEALEALWENSIRDAREAWNAGASVKATGTLPLGVERMLQELMHPVTDWRILLNDFVQEQVVDYSFLPPDRRFSEGPFMLPDFNETETEVRNILFMIDTSASMSTEDITRAYSEVKGAIDQFCGKLEGWLGFFDVEVVPPVPFANVEDLSSIRPKGGGGTSFHAVFQYIQQEMAGEEIASVIILTDGYAPFPDKSEAMGIPVLWLLISDESNEIISKKSWENINPEENRSYI